MNIGLSQRVLSYKDREYDCLSRDFYRLFKGHTLIPIPNGYDIDYDELANTLDLLVLTGGDASKDRIITEANICSRMMKLNKPILGICHGAFLLTEIFNGEVEESLAEWGEDHCIVYHGTAHLVNSYHTNVITKAPKHSTTLCVDEEGYIESWIKDNVAAVVWHPERMDTFWMPREVEQLINKQLTHTRH